MERRAMHTPCSSRDRTHARARLSALHAPVALQVDSVVRALRRAGACAPASARHARLRRARNRRPPGAVGAAAHTPLPEHSHGGIGGAGPRTLAGGARCSRMAQQPTSCRPSHVWTPLPEHWVAPGARRRKSARDARLVGWSRAAHAHAGVAGLDPVPEHWVAPRAHTPTQPPPTQASSQSSRCPIDPRRCTAGSRTPASCVVLRTQAAPPALFRPSSVPPSLPAALSSVVPSRTLPRASLSAPASAGSPLLMFPAARSGPQKPVNIEMETRRTTETTLIMFVPSRPAPGGPCINAPINPYLKFRGEGRSQIAGAHEPPHLPAYSTYRAPACRMLRAR